ncbi:Uncharacterised protein [Acinetobacter baumannii]|nr:Uncharacterised protein [Acinetobacter baumannii]
MMLTVHSAAYICSQCVRVNPISIMYMGMNTTKPYAAEVLMVRTMPPRPIFGFSNAMVMPFKT